MARSLAAAAHSSRSSRKECGSRTVGTADRPDRVGLPRPFSGRRSGGAEKRGVYACSSEVASHFKPPIPVGAGGQEPPVSTQTAQTPLSRAHERQNDGPNLKQQAAVVLWPQCQTDRAPAHLPFGSAGARVNGSKCARSWVGTATHVASPVRHRREEVAS